MKKTERRNIVNFWELSEEWQEEARRNLDEYCEECSYLEPKDCQNPENHVLWDLSECMPVKNQRYNAVIGISNNSAMALKINGDFTEAVIWFLY